MAGYGSIGGPFWSNGPAPGEFYNFPGNAAHTAATNHAAPGSFGFKRDG